MTKLKLNGYYTCMKCGNKGYMYGFCTNCGGQDLSSNRIYIYNGLFWFIVLLIIVYMSFSYL